jgi:NADH-quinone oxidoreductase subunit M
MLQSLFFGELPKSRADFPDLSRAEAAALGILLALVVLIGVWPWWLLETIRTGAAFATGAP